MPNLRRPANLSWASALAVGDFDGDGDPDLAAAGLSLLAWYERTPSSSLGFVERDRVSAGANVADSLDVISARPGLLFAPGLVGGGAERSSS